MAGATGLETPASAVTGQRSNQLNYFPTCQINDFAENLAGQGICRFCIECTVRTECPSKPVFLAKSPVNRPQISERTAVLPRTIRADGQEEITGKRTSQKHPNSFPSSGKGRVAVFEGPAILAIYNPLRSHTRFCDQPQTRIHAQCGLIQIPNAKLESLGS